MTAFAARVVRACPFASLLAAAACATAPPPRDDHQQPRQRQSASVGETGTPAIASASMRDTLTGYGVPRGRSRFLWQNDSWFSDSDRFYTNGTGLGWTLADSAVSDWIRDGLTWLPRRGTPSGTASELFLRQDMFTPEDFRTRDLVPDDRPYAGWLHLDFSHQLLTLDAGEDRRDHLDTWSVELGIVGPSSLADDVQRQVHEVVGADQPLGWTNQLKDEPGIVLGYRRDFRAHHGAATVGPFETDFVGSYGLRLGNVDTSARLGAAVRFGLNLPRHFGTAIRSLRETSVPHRVHLTTGVEGRVVLYNIFLDGNTYRSSHSVDRNVLVADFHVGLVWEPCSGTRLSVLEFFSTPEFDSPSQDGDVGHFTSVQWEVFF